MVTVVLLLIVSLVIIIIVAIVAKIYVDRKSKDVEQPTDEVDLEGSVLLGTDETDSPSPSVSVTVTYYWELQYYSNI